ncbi:MAG: hypothetical protein H7210_14085, partial [Pyrinomonadaceae bacterium]|nr:hypothetical protein [Phycisphaerales bacterium]
ADLNALIYNRATIVETPATDGANISHDLKKPGEADKAASASTSVPLPPRPIRREEIAMHIGAMARKALDAINTPAAVKEPAGTTRGLTAFAEAPSPSATPAPPVPPTATDPGATDASTAVAATSPAAIAEPAKPLDEARTWTMAFHEVFKNYDIAQHMKDVFLDEAIDDQARASKLIELGDLAREQLKNLIRETRIRRKLQPELVSFALATGLGETLAVNGVYNGAFPTGGIMIDTGLLVSLIVDKSDQAMLKKLSDAGLRVESHDDQINVVVGVVPLGKLASVVLVEGVRKMEMTKE